MADISLKIKSDFEQAEKDFKDLAASSESARAQIAKFSASFKTEQIDKFIEKNKLSAIAVSATSGKFAGMQKEAAGLQREMQRLISKGLDPQSASIKKLEAEYTRLNSDMAKSQKGVNNLSGSFSSGIKSILAYAGAYISFRAAVGFLKNVTSELATNGDELSKTSRRMGITVEALQELQYAAERSGVSTEILNKSLEQMNKTVGQSASGQGALYSYLNKTNPALLSQVQNAKNSEEAFNILTTAISDTKNPLDKAALASAAFGRSGQGIITMTENGADGIAKLREEAGRYGNIMSTEAAEASEKFKDAQLNLQSALKGVALSVGSQLLEPLANAMQSFAEWASEGDRLYNILSVIGKILVVVGPAIIAYMVATKAVAVATALWTLYQNGLNAALLANPIGLVIAGIAALIAIGILLYKNWDVVKAKFVSAIETMKINAQIAWEAIKIGFFYAAQGIINAVLLINKPFFFVIDQIITAFNKMTGKEIPLLSSSVKKFANGFDKSIAESSAKINKLQADKAYNAYRAAEAEKQALQQVNDANNKRTGNAKDNTKIILDENEKIKDSNKSKERNFKDMLNAITISEQAANRAQANEAMKFFEQRAEMEGTNHETRMEYLASQQAQIIAMENLTAQERLNAEKGLAAAIAAEEKKMWDTKVMFMQESISSTSSMLTDLQTVFKNAGKESRTLAVLLKGTAIAEATINSYLAFTKALATYPPPMSYIAAGLALAAGIAKVAAISTTPIPSAQTGGEFTIPDTPVGKNDRTAVMASPGETVSVSPRGMGGEKTTYINIDVGETNIFRVIQKGIDTGKIKLNNKNIGRGVFA